ncbi:MAG: polysaccharide deacetylase family protein [Bacteroidota bacterium]|nr:polysaccharide deacetylase family protein [Bacteroidota bacterium]MDX5430571.1 polysaccharide deacetylase family protein [Bacteroidota bacterium]MDX5469323.1 polysaccharide deacetylase family protein [Bacteroidota bacterium]
MKWSLLSLLLLLFACHENTPRVGGKVLILFDDWNTANWIQFEDSFQKYGIKATFFVSHYNSFDSSAKAQLSSLQATGHEIGFHGDQHRFIKGYENQSEFMTTFLKHEIDEGVLGMRKAGFNPQSYAFPGDYSTPSYRDSLLQRFAVVRKGSYGFFEYWERSRNYRLLAHEPDSFMCYDISQSSNFQEDQNMLMMIEDVAMGKNIALLLHSFDDSSSVYSSSSVDFFNMIRRMHHYGARFETVSDFYFPKTLDGIRISAQNAPPPAPSGKRPIRYKTDPR